MLRIIDMICGVETSVNGKDNRDNQKRCATDNALLKRRMLHSIACSPFLCNWVRVSLNKACDYGSAELTDTNKAFKRDCFLLC